MECVRNREQRLHIGRDRQSRGRSQHYLDSPRVAINKINYVPLWLSSLAIAYAELSQSEDASRCIDEAIAVIDASGERWCEAEVRRIAGESHFSR